MHRKSFKSLMFVVFFVSSSFFSEALRAQSQNGGGYCLALRGNGELMPAHWGALARTIETFGVPEAMAGGSSASISSFLWESIMANPEIQKISNPMIKAQSIALLFKSLEGLVRLRIEQPEWQKVIAWINELDPKNPQVSLSQIAAWIQQIQTPQMALQKTKEIQSVLMSLRESRIFFGPAVRKTLLALQQGQQKIFLQRFAELKKSFAVFGKFDAKNDTQLFVRDGIADFDALAKGMGAIADFLSLRGANDGVLFHYKAYLNTCVSPSQNRSFNELVAEHNECYGKLAAWAKTYFASYEQNSKSRVFELLGTYSPVVISTSIVMGSSAKKLHDLKSNYDNTYDSNIGKDMRIENADLRFGYWGNPQTMGNIANRLKATSDKTRRFLNLGSTNWLTALSLSPAEPGLSPMQFIGTKNFGPLVSLGGWSDLHPVQVLRAAGCNHVVFVTRRGGDSLFGTGVAKQLLGLEETSWDLLDGQGPGKISSNIHNNNGDANDTNSQWGRMFNLRNPQSSFAEALAQASAVVCTDWNAFDVKKQLSPLIEDSYRAPIYNPTNLKANNRSKVKWLTEADLQTKSAKGDFSEFAGCIPYQ